LDAASVPPDNDGDKVSDINDEDDDNDGVPDGSDAFPFDPNEFQDTDGDGIGNRADPDDDNDGYTDADELTENQSDPLNPKSVPVDNDGDMISDLNDQDDDNDGMPDAWESQYEGLNQMVDDADEDMDGDGQSNYAEYVAGTDPVDPSSVFQAELLIIQPGSFTLKWNSVPGRIYRIWLSYDLATWTLVSEGIGADSESGGAEWTNSLHLEEKQGYYRVEVLP
jgi:hypothetical protein